MALSPNSAWFQAGETLRIEMAGDFDQQCLIDTRHLGQGRVAQGGTEAENRAGGVPGSGGTDWEQITYTYDPSGRRIAKDVDGEVTKYVYDGDQCIAEYDANDVLLRKYVYGPGIDEPICMVEAAGGYAGTYYYHYDALGSVVALSDAAGDTVQVYEYDVYGQVAASDPNHPNRFMFTGREFDSETGLYYYRARYYNPTLGRFLQTDPACEGMNWYAYCGNDPIGSIDPTGCHELDYHHFHFAMPAEIVYSGLSNLSPSDIAYMVGEWFEVTMAALDEHPCWRIYDATLDSDGVTLDVVIAYVGAPASNGPPPTWPSMYILWAAVVCDNTPLVFGGYVDDTPFDNVPMVVVDDVVMLDSRAFNRIMAPAIAEVDGWATWYGLLNRYIPLWVHKNLINNWDSWFRDASGVLFKWEGTKEKYSGDAINYYVGGCAFAHYNFSYPRSVAYIYAWKLVNNVARGRGYRSPWDPSLDATWFWFGEGYSAYSWRR